MQTDKQLTMAAAWFGAASTSLLISILFLLYLSFEHTSIPVAQNFKLYAALPDNTQIVTDSIEIKDARAKIVEDFFLSYKSQLADYSNYFIQVADKYNLDYRLLPAISMQESNGGRRMIKDSYNPFGFGIYGSKALKFESFEEAIEKVGYSLREDYLNQGLETTEEIMTKYTPPSLEKGGAWAKGVNTFISEML